MVAACWRAIKIFIRPNIFLKFYVEYLENGPIDFYWTHAKSYPRKSTLLMTLADPQFKVILWKLTAGQVFCLTPRPHRAGALSDDGCRLSVCPVPDPKSRTERRSKLKIGSKTVTGYPWHHLEIEKSNACRRGGHFGAAQLCVLQGH